jgi:hypothetical protein
VNWVSVKALTAPAVAAVACLAASTCVAAYTQNVELEAGLSTSDPKVLMLFPAKGYRDGAAGFFRDNDLEVVPGSERAWCQERDRGVLKPGCYVEWFYHRRGFNQRTWDGEPCGYLARWYRAPGTNAYAPTSGSPFADLIARGDIGALELEETSRPPTNVRALRRFDWCSTESVQR